VYTQTFHGTFGHEYLPQTSWSFIWLGLENY